MKVISPLQVQEKLRGNNFMFSILMLILVLLFRLIQQVVRGIYVSKYESVLLSAFFYNWLDWRNNWKSHTKHTTGNERTVWRGIIYRPQSSTQGPETNSRWWNAEGDIQNQRQSLIVKNNILIFFSWIIEQIYFDLYIIQQV